MVIPINPSNCNFILPSFSTSKILIRSPVNRNISIIAAPSMDNISSAINEFPFPEIRDTPQSRNTFSSIFVNIIKEYIQTHTSIDILLIE